MKWFEITIFIAAWNAPKTTVVRSALESNALVVAPPVGSRMEPVALGSTPMLSALEILWLMIT